MKNDRNNFTWISQLVGISHSLKNERWVMISSRQQVRSSSFTSGRSEQKESRHNIIGHFCFSQSTTTVTLMHETNNLIRVTCLHLRLKRQRRHSCITVESIRWISINGSTTWLIHIYQSNIKLSVIWFFSFYSPFCSFYIYIEAIKGDLFTQTIKIQWKILTKVKCNFFSFPFMNHLIELNLNSTLHSPVGKLILIQFK